MEIKIVSLRNRFPIGLFIGRFFYFREKLKPVSKPQNVGTTTILNDGKNRQYDVNRGNYCIFLETCRTFRDIF
ncbi:hypothetical protein LEP1GSC062_2308 [Leptospira alexanderi serovar Manhao 3 str. L 60]|uniref:Uncharacterized protein n=1 Tax=Leptospira alexanderi serovar Manhao 3 str. L 60 TaxID=1049759 RepID=V6IGC6_9LEPT|nr:hypothetical protein LEP1GSC062_2308 [Leptospira alexanderi serovar Manhao 3 str. L 60]